MKWTVADGEEARLTPEGPTAGRIESRGSLPLRVRSLLGAAAHRRPHPGTAVVLGTRTYEVVGEEASAGSVVYRLEPWPADQTIRDRVSYGPRLVRAAQEQRRRESRGRWAGPLLGVFRVLAELLLALLPAPERRSLADRLSLDALRGTALLLALQLFGGGVLWGLGLVSFGQARLEAVAGEYTKRATAPSDEEVKQAYGPFRGGSGSWSPTALTPLAYAFSPRGLGLEYAFLTGLLRLFSFVMNRQPLGDPVLSGLLWGSRSLRKRRRERERLAALGPERPDRVVEAGEDLVVLASREKPEWRERATVGIGERLYSVRGVEVRPDGAWNAVAYRLSPLEPGAIARGLIRYLPPGTASELPPAPRAAPATQPGPAPAPPPGAAAAARPATAARARFRVDEGEEARVTAEGPTAAVIESLGSLPLRPRSEALGVHHRPEFPGTCVVLGAGRFEVVEEQPLETGVRYLLEPWPAQLVVRDTVVYGPGLVRAAQEERRRALQREQAAKWSPLLYPLIGLLPEERQLLACDRFGLDPFLSTIAGIALEVGGALGVALFVIPDLGSATMLTYQLLAWVFVIPALLRLVGAMVAGEVSGSTLLGAPLGLLGTFGRGLARADSSVLPLTREAFWARLARPDRLDEQLDGSLVVRGLLPHLSWGQAPGGLTLGRLPAIAVGDDYWNVAPLPPTVEKGRLTYAYHLWPLRVDGMLADLPEPRPPDPRHYQQGVLEEVAREWDGVFRAAPWLPPLLPTPVQERAYRLRGGAAAARSWTLATALAELGGFVWFASGHGLLNLATGLLLLADGGLRAWRATSEAFAPSVFGWLFADLLRPERVAYLAHRDAERATLRALGSRS